MKKFAFVAAVLFTLGMTGCSKDYTCTCNYNDGSQDVTTSSKIEDAKKDDAETACEEAEDVLKVVDSNATCSLD